MIRQSPAAEDSGLARKLGTTDLTMIVMGSIVGTSIFVVPQVVALRTGSQTLLFAAWILGGLLALAGGFIAAELAWRRPLTGGSYAYLRDAYHPMVAFLYGWCLLLIVQTGSVASVAVVFARYCNELAGTHIPEGYITTSAIAALTVVNCFGVRTGSMVQSVLMGAKIVVLGSLILAGLLVAAPASRTNTAYADGSGSLAGFGAAMVLVLFSYGGWQMAAFLAGEARDVRRTLPRSLILGVTGVVVLYLGVNIVCVRVLGDSMAHTKAPASAVMAAAFGEAGAIAVGAGIAISAVGYLSQATLTSPRVYYAMARDGAFFAAIGRVHPRTKAPVAAIVLQGVVSIVIALSGQYHQILNYVMSVEILFNVMTIGSLFIYRRRDRRAGESAGSMVPLHPYTTVAVMGVNALVALSLFYTAPVNGLIGIAIAAAGMPVYFIWRRSASSPPPTAFTVAPQTAASSDGT